LAVRKTGDEDYRWLDQQDDPFVWDRFIKRLKQANFGSYQECAAADLKDAMIFLLLENDFETVFWRMMGN
jgi:hypothetical protein